jgi:hypothetical protein
MRKQEIKQKSKSELLRKEGSNLRRPILWISSEARRGAADVSIIEHSCKITNLFSSYESTELKFFQARLTRVGWLDEARDGGVHAVLHHERGEGKALAHQPFKQRHVQVQALARLH